MMAAQLKYAIENKLRAIDTMASTSLLNDGVYKHKREWGAAALPNDKSHNWVYFFNAYPSEGTARFFETNPIIAHSDRGQHGVIGVSAAMDISIEAINDLVRQHCASGLQGFTVVTRTGSWSVAKTNVATTATDGHRGSSFQLKTLFWTAMWSVSYLLRSYEASQYEFDWVPI